MNRFARQQGFPDYVTMQAYYRHRSASLRRPGPAQQAPKNWLQTLIDKIPWHPSYLLGHANKRIEQETGQ